MHYAVIVEADPREDIETCQVSTHEADLLGKDSHEQREEHFRDVSVPAASFPTRRIANRVVCRRRGEVEGGILGSFNQWERQMAPATWRPLAAAAALNAWTTNRAAMSGPMKYPTSFQDPRSRTADR